MLFRHTVGVKAQYECGLNGWQQLENASILRVHSPEHNEKKEPGTCSFLEL